ncbi:MAG: hypothetical protein AAB434_03605 [Planctomycetota bacterium]
MAFRPLHLALLLAVSRVVAAADPETIEDAIAQVKAITDTDPSLQTRLRAEAAQRIVANRVKVLNDLSGTTLQSIPVDLWNWSEGTIKDRAEVIEKARKMNWDMARVAWILKGGMCDEHASLVVEILRKSGENAVVLRSPRHAFPVVGMAADADPDIPWTWGDKALVPDSWKGETLGPEEVWSEALFFDGGESHVYSGAKDALTTREWLRHYNERGLDLIQQHRAEYEKLLAKWHRIPAAIRYRLAFKPIEDLPPVEDPGEGAGLADGDLDSVIQKARTRIGEGEAIRRALLEKLTEFYLVEPRTLARWREISEQARQLATAYRTLGSLQRLAEAKDSLPEALKSLEVAIPVLQKSEADARADLRSIRGHLDRAAAASDAELDAWIAEGTALLQKWLTLLGEAAKEVRGAMAAPQWLDELSTLDDMLAVQQNQKSLSLVLSPHPTREELSAQLYNAVESFYSRFEALVRDRDRLGNIVWKVETMLRPFGEQDEPKQLLQKARALSDDLELPEASPKDTADIFRECEAGLLEYQSAGVSERSDPLPNADDVLSALREGQSRYETFREPAEKLLRSAVQTYREASDWLEELRKVRAARGASGGAADEAGSGDGADRRAEALAAAQGLLKLAREKDSEARTAASRVIELQKEAAEREDAAGRTISAWQKKIEALKSLPQSMDSLRRLTEALRPRIAELDAAYEALTAAIDESRQVEERVKGFAEACPGASEAQVKKWKEEAGLIIADVGHKISNALQRAEAIENTAGPLENAIRNVRDCQASVSSLDRAPSEVGKLVLAAQDSIGKISKARADFGTARQALVGYRNRIEELLRPYKGSAEADELVSLSLKLGAGPEEPRATDVEGRGAKLQPRAEELYDQIRAIRAALGNTDPAQVLAAAERVLTEFDDVRIPGAFATRGADGHVERALAHYHEIQYTPSEAANAPEPPAPDPPRTPPPPQKPEITIKSLSISPAVLEPGKEASVWVEFSVTGFAEASTAAHVTLWLDADGTGTALSSQMDVGACAGTLYTGHATWPVPADARAGPVKASGRVNACGIEAKRSADGVIKGVSIDELKASPASVKPGGAVDIVVGFTAWGFAEKTVRTRMEVRPDFGPNKKYTPMVWDEVHEVAVTYTGKVSYTVPAQGCGDAYTVSAKAQAQGFSAVATVGGTIQAAEPPAPPPAEPPPSVEDPLVGEWIGTESFRVKEGKRFETVNRPVSIGIRRSDQGYIVWDMTDGQETRATYATENTIGWAAGDAARWDMRLTAPGEMSGTYRVTIMKETHQGTLTLKRR